MATPSPSNESETRTAFDPSESREPRTESGANQSSHATPPRLQEVGRKISTPYSDKAGAPDFAKPRNKNLPRETHERITPLIDKEMKNATKDEIDGLDEFLVPDKILPFNVNAILRDVLTAPEKQRQTRTSLASSVNQNFTTGYDSRAKKWIAWPGAHDSEGLLADYFNDLAAKVRNAVPELRERPIPRRWTAAKKTKCIPDERCDRKPDIIMLDNEIADSAIIWKDCQVCFEIKKNKDEKESVLKQLQSSARLTFGKQTGRRFVIGIYLRDDILGICLFNRSGRMSVEVNVHDEPETLVRVVIGLLFVKDVHIGFDPTIYKKPSESKPGEPATYILLNKIEYEVLEKIHQESSIRGRGTTIFKVKDKLGAVHVIKDVWVDDSRVYQEHQALEDLKDVDGIPRLEAYEIVNPDDKWHTTSIAFEKLDVTFPEGEEIETRTHKRYLLDVVGEDISSFRSKKELLKGFIDWITGMQLIL